MSARDICIRVSETQNEQGVVIRRCFAVCSSLLSASCFLVRIDKSGQETYCIVHLKVRLDQGMFLGGVQSIIPLPDDPSRPPPPFVEGVDLEEETLLYGYRPPQ